MSILDPKTLKEQIASVESQGNYKAGAKNRGTSNTATGKYQFIWSKWGKQIAEVTGVKSRDGFLNNPKAQEQFMDHYISNDLTPKVNILRQEGLGKDFSDEDLAKIIHLEGFGGARQKLKTNTLDKKTGNSRADTDTPLGKEHVTSAESDKSRDNYIKRKALIPNRVE